MTFLVFKREVRRRGCTPILIGAISDVGTIEEACERLGLKFSMQASVPMGSQEEECVAYKKSKSHKTQFFLREINELQTKNDI